MVCSDSSRSAAVATFILMRRGFNTRSLCVPLGEVLAEENIGSRTETEPAPTDESEPLAPVGEGSRRVSPGQFADIITGKDRRGLRRLRGRGGARYPTSANSGSC
mgnify:CR=1 FL=1